MNAAVPTFREMWLRSKRERRVIVVDVMMADDIVRSVRFGPRGGWSFA